MSVKPIPDGYHTVTPYITVSDGAAALEFYEKALGATVVMRFDTPDGRVAHAEIQIGDSKVMLGGECPVMGNKSPLSLGGTTGGLCVYVEDCDALFDRALGAGAHEQRLRLADVEPGQPRPVPVLEPVPARGPPHRHEGDARRGERHRIPLHRPLRHLELSRELCSRQLAACLEHEQERDEPLRTHASNLIQKDDRRCRESHIRSRLQQRKERKRWL